MGKIKQSCLGGWKTHIQDTKIILPETLFRPNLIGLKWIFDKSMLKLVACYRDVESETLMCGLSGESKFERGWKEKALISVQGLMDVMEH